MVGLRAGTQQSDYEESKIIPNIKINQLSNSRQIQILETDQVMLTG